MTGHWLSYFNLSDEYERRARYVPALLALLLLLPFSGTLGMPISGWLGKIIAGAGAAAVLGVGLSHLASAFGNHFQRRLWPRWPHDSPTNEWLKPNSTARSTQQKASWYEAIKQQTGLDIGAAASDASELEAVINDAVTQLRNRLWKSEHADRMRMHNTEYGFARNITGLRPIWVTGALIGTGLSWYRYFVESPAVTPSLLLTGYLIVLLILAFKVLPVYTRQRAEHYAESFFSAMLALASAPAKH